MKFKKINPNESVFYVFEVLDNYFSIFDSRMDEPIYHGNNQKMYKGIVKNIKKHISNVIVHTFLKNGNGNFKFNLPKNNFLIFEYDNDKYSMFTNDLDTPIGYGSWNLIDTKVNKIQSGIIYYFSRDKNLGFKLNNYWSETLTKNIAKAE